MHDRGDSGKNSSKRGAWVNLGKLVRKAIDDPSDAERAYGELRVLYGKSEYRNVWPSNIIRIDDRPLTGGPKPKKRQWLFMDNRDGRCFVRNLWFLHSFFRIAKDVKRFLTGDAAAREEQFRHRSEEIRELSKDYGQWSAASQLILSKLVKFESTQMDLYALANAEQAPTEADQLRTLAGSPAIADLIREIEDRASYQAGNPADACEKALYFLELGRVEVAQRIARGVLAESPNDPVALYTNAVLLLESRNRQLETAFLHDNMHPSGLTPITAEEQWHSDAHDEALENARRDDDESFRLLLRAWERWPEEWLIKSFRLRPEMWKGQIEEIILHKAAARISTGRYQIGRGDDKDSQATAILKSLVQQVSAQCRRSISLAFVAKRLRDLIVVAARTLPDAGRSCLAAIEQSLAQKSSECSIYHDAGGVELPVSQYPSLAEDLGGTPEDQPFCSAMLTLIGAEKTLNLLRKIEWIGEQQRRDRALAKHGLAMRALICQTNCTLERLAESHALCRGMAEGQEWPETQLGQIMRRCWRYSVIRILLESSWVAIDARRTQEAIEFASSAVHCANSWFEDVTGNGPLLRFVQEDEFGETENHGDWLRCEPNVITTPNAAGCLGLQRLWLLRPPIPPEEFVKWADSKLVKETPLLIAFARWLIEQYADLNSLEAETHALASRVAGA